MILRYTGGIYMKGKMNTDLGQVLISPEVIAKYAGTTACECFGIVGMAMVSVKDGLVKERQLIKRNKCYNWWK